MRRIYMDGGATSYPKAPGVARRVYEYLEHQGSSVGRSGSNSLYEADRVLYETRERIAELFGFARPEHVIFTKNVTESLNLLLKGFLNPGDHVLVSSVEHNAVMRPLTALRERGVRFDTVPSVADGSGAIDAEAIGGMIRPETVALVCTHASNVSGTVHDAERIGAVCRERGIRFFLDVAQTAGSIEIDTERFCADAVAFTGHKGLLAPQGIGGLLMSDELTRRVRPLIEGGTGSLSEAIVQPEFLPDKFEAGTPNIPAVYGLHQALGFIAEVGVQEIHRREMELTALFLDRIAPMEGVRVVGRGDTENRTGVVSIDVCGADHGDLAHRLARDFGVITRSGMHCAPCAHRTLGTEKRGTVRFGVGYFLAPEDIYYAADSLERALRAIRAERR